MDRSTPGLTDTPLLVAKSVGDAKLAVELEVLEAPGAPVEVVVVVTDSVTEPSGLIVVVSDLTSLVTSPFRSIVAVVVVTVALVLLFTCTVVVDACPSGSIYLRGLFRA